MPAAPRKGRRFEAWKGGRVTFARFSLQPLCSDQSVPICIQFRSSTESVSIRELAGLPKGQCSLYEQTIFVVLRNLPALCTLTYHEPFNSTKPQGKLDKRASIAESIDAIFPLFSTSREYVPVSIS